MEAYVRLPFVRRETRQIKGLLVVVLLVFVLLFDSCVYAVVCHVCITSTTLV